MPGDGSSVIGAAVAWLRAEEPAAGLLGRCGTGLGYELGVLWLCAAGVDALEAVSVWSAPGRAEPDLDGAEELAARACGDGAAIVTDRHPEDPAPRVRAWAARSGMRSGLIVPLSASESPLVVLALHTPATQLPPGGTLAAFDQIAGLVSDRLVHQIPIRELSGRQIAVLRLVAVGRTNAEIAAELFVSPATVKTHLAHIYARLGVGDRAAAVAQALRSGLIG